ncbi:Capsule polysaccharide biosynthesis protein [Roseibium album]|nr:Capsule polysaccharide biosynthesis protein [Roseibium album]
MRIAIATSGMWPLKDAIEQMLGGTAFRLGRFHRTPECVAGWGHKPTAARARAYAWSRNIPYIAFEDGFLRSVQPGRSERPVSLVLDRTGIYYDATAPSDLEGLIVRNAGIAGADSAGRDIMDALRSRRLSKYNNAVLDDLTGFDASISADRVLVVDQTAGDASIRGAMASDDTFQDMLVTAVSENPGADILVRVHPETAMGVKSGHFTPQAIDAIATTTPAVRTAIDTARLRLVSEPVNPWVLLEACSRLYCVSSQLGFEGLMAGCEVNCFGMPFYGGWGLTRDRRVSSPLRRGSASLGQLAASVYLDYMYYFSFSSNERITFGDACEIISRKRVNILKNSSK